MKPVCYPHRHASASRWLLCAGLLIIGLTLISLALASCGKPKSDEANQPKQDQGWNITPQPARSVLGRAVQKSISVECQSNLNQIRQLIEMYKSENNGANPPALSAMPEAARISKCPISKQDYQYDPATGKVSCTFQGHENL